MCTWRLPLLRFEGQKRFPYVNTHLHISARGNFMHAAVCIITSQSNPCAQWICADGVVSWFGKFDSLLTDTLSQ
jgi:hypothetical protein